MQDVRREIDAWAENYGYSHGDVEGDEKAVRGAYVTEDGVLPGFCSEETVLNVSIRYAQGEMRMNLNAADEMDDETYRVLLGYIEDAVPADVEKSLAIDDWI